MGVGRTYLETILCVGGGLTWRQCVGKFDLKVCGGAVLVVPGHDDHHTPAPAHKNSYLNLEWLEENVDIYKDQYNMFTFHFINMKGF